MFVGEGELEEAILEAVSSAQLHQVAVQLQHREITGGVQLRLRVNKLTATTAGDSAWFLHCFQVLNKPDECHVISTSHDTDHMIRKWDSLLQARTPLSGLTPPLG